MSSISALYSCGLLLISSLAFKKMTCMQQNAMNTVTGSYGWQMTEYYVLSAFINERKHSLCTKVDCSLQCLPCHLYFPCRWLSRSPQSTFRWFWSSLSRQTSCYSSVQRHLPPCNAAVTKSTPSSDKPKLQRHSQQQTACCLSCHAYLVIRSSHVSLASRLMHSYRDLPELEGHATFCKLIDIQRLHDALQCGHGMRHETEV